MPRKRKNETRQDYISRAIPYLMKKEGLSQKAAVGKAHGLARQKFRKTTRSRR